MTSAQALWGKLDARRTEILRRAEEASKLTLPHIFPELGNSENHKLPTPYQSIGAMGVNNLASKLVLTLFPPTSKFMRFAISEADLVEIAEAEAAGAKSEIQLRLSQLESATQTDFERLGIRPMIVEALLHELITGNGCLMIPPTGEPNFFGLRRYVVDRDADDKISTLIIREEVPQEQASPELKALMAASMTRLQSGEAVPVFTISQRTGPDEYTTWQEIGDGTVIPDSKREYTSDTLPFVVLRFTKVHGEHYGRGMIEQYAGDLISAEALSASLVDLSSAASRIVYVLRPGSAITPMRWSEAQNGEAITGEEGDVSVAQPNVTASISTIAQMLQDVIARLQQVFLMTQGVQRQAERVTAQEIRLVAQELQDTLGGTFALMAEDLQLPLVRLVVARMRAQGDFPDLPEGLIEPKIVTGIEGLGRNQDSNRLLQFWQDLAGVIGPERAIEQLNVPEFTLAFAAARGVDSKFIRSAEEVAQSQEAAQQAQLAQQAVGPGIQAAAQIATQG